MEGLAFMSGDSVIVVDVPPPPTRPADVGDLGEREQRGRGARGGEMSSVNVVCSFRRLFR